MDSQKFKMRSINSIKLIKLTPKPLCMMKSKRFKKKNKIYKLKLVHTNKITLSHQRLMMFKSVQKPIRFKILKETNFHL